MIVVRETSKETFEPITGNPTLTSLDGTKRAPLRTILSQSWTAEMRAEFGIYLAEPVEIPEGKRALGSPRYERQGSAIAEVYDLENEPRQTQAMPAEIDKRTAEEKVADLASALGVTLDEFRAVIIGGKA